VDRFDAGQLVEADAVAPIEEVCRSAVVRQPCIFISNGRREELQKPACRMVARRSDDRRHGDVPCSAHDRPRPHNRNDFGSRFFPHARLPHLLEAVAALEKRGVGFRSITEAIDTTSPGGRLVFHLFGALGQFERDLIQERTRAGLAAAAARGRKGGRKLVITADKLERARGMVAKGLTVREAASRLKVGKTALYEALRSEPNRAT
jgi:hypothetical protein